MRKFDDREKKGGTEIVEIVAANIVASCLPEWRSTAMPSLVPNGLYILVYIAISSKSPFKNYISIGVGWGGVSDYVHAGFGEIAFCTWK